MPSLEDIQQAIRTIPDFPKPGILFRDITPVLGDGKLFRATIQLYVEALEGKGVGKIVGVDARGFIFGAAVACEMGLGFVPVRKRGKLPFETLGESYDLEYGSAELEMHVDAIAEGERVAVVDDLLATGGTAAAAVELVRRAGGEMVDLLFLIELEALGGRAKLRDVPVTAFLRY